MQNDTRKALELGLSVLNHWLHSGCVEKPTAAQYEAIRTAISAMEQLRRKGDYEQPIAILSYHVKHPTADLFRDPVTIKAVKAGIDAMKRMLEGRR